MSINWWKLYSEGRCREIGISWTEEELKELYVEKSATVDEIRARYYPEQIQELQEKIDEVAPVVVETTTPTDVEVEVPEVIVKSTWENSVLDNLKQQATDLGIQFAPNIWEATLQKRIDDFNNEVKS